MTRPRKKWKIALLAVALLALAGSGAYAYRSRAAHGPDVRMHTVTRKSVAHTLQIAGKIVPVSSMVITPRQSGRVVELSVQEGSQVNPGDLLFTMRLEAEGQTELLQKRAEVRRLELEVQAQGQRLDEKRPIRELIGSASVLRDESELEKVKLELAAARERLGVLESELGLAVKAGAPKAGKRKTDALAETLSAKSGLVYVSSPRKGIVTLIDKRPGDFVLGGAGGDASATERMVMVVADMSSLQVRTRVLEADLRYVKPEIPVRVKLDAYPDVHYDGRVTHIGGQGRVDAKAGYTYFDVDVSVEQQDERVLPEMNATIELIFAKRENVLSLPVAAVAIFPDKAIVRLPDETSDDGWKELTVQVGVVNESDAEILVGLKEGDEVLEIDFSTLQLDDKDDPAVGDKGDKKKPKARPKRT